MQGLGCAPNLLLLFALTISTHAGRTIIRCDSLPLDLEYNQFDAPLSGQICAAGSNALYLQNIFIYGNGGRSDRNVSLYEIIRGDVSEEPGLSCYSVTNKIVYTYNYNAKIECEDPFFIYMEDERVAAVAVSHEQRITQINITDGRPIILLSPTGKIKLEFLQVASIRAGTNSGSRTIYNVNYGCTACTTEATTTEYDSVQPRMQQVDVPDTYVLFGTLIQIVPRNAEHFTISTSTDTLDEHILSPGSFVVVGTFAYPDARHLNGQDNRAVFKANESVQIDTFTNHFFDRYFEGGANIVTGGLWFNGTKAFSGPYNVSECFSYYGDSFEMRYLAIVREGALSWPNDDYFATEVRVRELPPDVTEPPPPSPQPEKPTVATQDTPYPARTELPSFTGETPEATTTGSSTRSVPTGFPSEDCECRYDNLWLDVVFLVEATDSMGHGIDDVIAFIQGALYQMSMGDRRFSSAIRQANDMLSQMSESRRARKVIVLVATAFRAGSYDDPHQIPEGFREAGGTIITIDYIEKDGIIDPKLTSLATPTYAYNNTNGVYTFGDDDILKAFCDINCFCSTNQRGFERGRAGLPARPAHRRLLRNRDTVGCGESGANRLQKEERLPPEHPQHKQRYLTSLFPPKTQHWIGLEREGASYSFIDYTSYDYSNWPTDADIGTGPAFYSWQYSGFRTGWFSATTTMSAQYTCQFAPCDSLYDACLV